MSEVKINAEPRTEFGKGGARRTRRAGKVPAVLYGHGEKPRHIALPARELAAALRHGGMTQVFVINIEGGGEALALPKAIQKDPIRDTYEHVDMLIVRRGEMVTVDVPIHLIGAAARDTLVTSDNDRLSIIADATKLPSFLEVSIEGLEAGSHVTAADVKLPAGVELAADPELILALVSAAQESQLEEPTEAAEGEAAEGAEGGEAAEGGESTES